MQTFLQIAVATIGMANVACYAQDQIYRCNGEYTNTVSEAQAASQSCKLVSPARPDPKLWQVSFSSENATYYRERDTPQREGAWLKAWFLISYAKQEKNYQGKTINSKKRLMIFDCAARTHARKQEVAYSDSNGTGATVETGSIKSTELEFDDPVPGSIGEGMQKAVCNKK